MASEDLAWQAMSHFCEIGCSRMFSLDSSILAGSLLKNDPSVPCLFRFVSGMRLLHGLAESRGFFLMSRFINCFCTVIVPMLKNSFVDIPGKVILANPGHLISQLFMMKHSSLSPKMT